MRREDRQADDPMTWLEDARSDLAFAGVTLPSGGRYEHLCFHAQQAAEKALKAVLIHLHVDVPFTHNIQGLLDLVSGSTAVPENLVGTAVLTLYAVTTRYPGDTEPVTEQDYREALALAEMVVGWAESVVGANARDSA